MAVQWLLRHLLGRPPPLSSLPPSPLHCLDRSPVPDFPPVIVAPHCDPTLSPAVYVQLPSLWNAPGHPHSHLLRSSLACALLTAVQAAFGSLKDAYSTAAKAVGPGAAEASLKQFVGLEQLMLATVGVSHVTALVKWGAREGLG